MNINNYTVIDIYLQYDVESASGIIFEDQIN